MSRSLRNRVVVVTGASSGIGRATALELSRRGAAVAVAARRAEPLQRLVDEIRRGGGRALAVPLDVTDEAAVQELADRAVAELGRLDVWINNAGVSMLGRMDEAPHDAWRRVIDVNLMGYVHGAWAAIPHFRRQGHGVLVNNASIYSRGGGRYVSAYAASKFAIRGFSEALRQELQGTDIHVCTVLPGSVDTPIFQHAANFTGREAKALRPVNRVDTVARRIVECAERPRREVLVGRGARSLMTLHDTMPSLYELVAAQQVEHDHLRRRPAAPTTGNLFEPMAEGTDTTGGWRRPHGLGGRLARAALVATPAALIVARNLAARRNGDGAMSEGSAPAAAPATSTPAAGDGVGARVGDRPPTPAAAPAS